MEHVEAGKKAGQDRKEHPARRLATILQVRARVEDRRRYTKCFGYLLIIIGTVIGARWSFGREAPVSMVVV
jgi:disulfide bond formation protein DsbB